MASLLVERLHSVSIKKDENIVVANADNVKEIMEFFLKKTDEYTEMKEGKVDILDLFMGVHSFHKMIVILSAQMWEEKGNMPQDKTFRVADEDFRKAMKDCIRIYRQPVVTAEMH